MTNKILFVFDSSVKGGKAGSIPEGSRVVLCPLTSDMELVAESRKKIESRGGEVVEVNFPGPYNETAFSVKEDYLKFIAQFPEREFKGGKNLKEYLKMPGHDFSLWWLSLIAEKNTLKTTTFHRFVQFLTIKRITEEFPVSALWVNIEDRELAKTIKAFTASAGLDYKDLRGHGGRPEIVGFVSNLVRTVVYSSYYLVKLSMVKLKMGGRGSRLEGLGGARYVIVNYFPFADPGLLKENIFQDLYYQPFQRSLEKTHPGKYAWLSIMANTEEHGLGGSISLGKRINGWGETQYFLEEWLGPGDLLKIFITYLYTSLNFLKILPRLSREFTYPEGDTGLWQLYRQEWYSSFCGWTLVEGLAFYHAFCNAIDEMGDDAVVLYPAEMQAWEKALNIAARERGVRTVGVQHTTVPVLILAYFNHPKDMEEGDYVSKLPRPDLLACVGDVARKLFIESGWSEEQVFSWGAIRFEQYVSAMDNKVAWEDREDLVVVALSYSRKESGEVIRYIHEAFKDRPGYKVLIKGHPVHPVPPIVASLGISLDADVFQIVETPLGELMPRAKVMIVTESSAALESLANQCPVVIPRLANTLDMNPLTGISDLPIYVNTPVDLRDETDRIMSFQEGPITYEEYRKVIQEYCRFPESDDEYLRILEEKLKTFYNGTFK
jgi:surface carbohydrate biosynthesis protein (TIGR04326 family)